MEQPPSPAEAYFRQRHAIAASSAQLAAMRRTIGDPVNLNSPQWAQWFAYARDYRPDLILELGREYGNSTATFAQALHENRHGRLVSLCLSSLWQDHTVPLLRPLVTDAWFDRIDARIGDLLDVDFAGLMGDAGRVMVLWDAHGLPIAECVLGKLMPLLEHREHMVIMHDVSDRRYCGSPREYGDRELWKGRPWVDANGRHDCRVYLGWIDTCVDQPIVAVDFLERNGTELQSADHSFHTELGADPERCEEMARVLAADDWNLLGHWGWFTLNGTPEPRTFPRVAPRPEPCVELPAQEPIAPARSGLLGKLRGLLRR